MFNDCLVEAPLRQAARATVTGSVTGDIRPPWRREADTVIFWPTLLALIVASGALACLQAMDLRDHGNDAVDFYFFLLVIGGTLIGGPLWLVGFCFFVSTRRWRGLASGCAVPLAILLVLRPLGIIVGPMHRLIRSGVLEAQAAKSGDTPGTRFAWLDITQGLFVPPPELLIYDETGRLGLVPFRPTPQALSFGSDEQSIMRACTGRSTPVASHYYVCDPF